MPTKIHDKYYPVFREYKLFFKANARVVRVISNLYISVEQQFLAELLKQWASSVTDLRGRICCLDPSVEMYELK